MSQTTNALVVTRLREVADLLEQQDANAFRVSAEYKEGEDSPA